MPDLSEFDTSLPQGSDAAFSLPPDAPSSIADEKDAVDRRLSGARTRLVERLKEVGRRIEHAKDSMDVAEMIRTHPLLAVGIGLAVGSLAALPRGGNGTSLPGKAGGLIGGIALQLLSTGLNTWLRQVVAGPHDSNS